MSSTIKLKTLCMNITEPIQKRIFDYMTKPSKNIYNSTIFNTTIFNRYNNDIFKEIYQVINKMTDISKIDINPMIYERYNIKYNNYLTNMPIIKNNNEVIYKYIKSILEIRKKKKNTIKLSLKTITKLSSKKSIKELLIENGPHNNNRYLINDNYDVIRNIVIHNIIKNDKIIYNEENKQEVVIDVIDRILKSFYNKNYYMTKDELISKKPITIKDKKFIEQVKREEYIIKYKKYGNWKKKIENLLNKNVVKKEEKGNY